MLLFEPDVHTCGVLDPKPPVERHVAKYLGIVFLSLIPLLIVVPALIIIKRKNLLPVILNKTSQFACFVANEGTLHS